MIGRLKAVWPFALIGLLAVLLAFQTLRIDGFRFGHVKMFGADFWVVDFTGFKPALASCTADRAAIIRAQDEAAALQAAVNEDEERRTADNAQRSELDHAQDLARAVAADRNFADHHRIAADRMRASGDRGASGQASAAAASGGAGIPQILPTDSFVAVADPDLQACTAAVTYAVSAHNWAATIPLAPVRSTGE